MLRIITASLLFLLIVQGVRGQLTMTREQYIARYKVLAIEERDLSGIPASITMAQALLESDNGNSRLAVLANNHFGIKCKKDWTGQTISHDDDSKGECFRKYACAEDSFRDHSEFLENSSRYASLFKLSPTDYQGWAYGLRAAGYATNPNYANQLIKIIEDNQLYLLDADITETIAQESSTEQSAGGEAWDESGQKVDVDNYMISVRSLAGYPLYSNNGSEFILSGETDTYALLASKLDMSEKRLRKLNDQPTGPLHPLEMVYVKPKQSKAINGKLIHVATEGETLRDVAQHYGVRLKSLAALNMRPSDSVLHEGQQLRLK